MLPLLHCCCHHKDCSSSLSSLPLPPPLASLHVLHPRPLVMSSAAGLPWVTPLPPACLALPPTPPPSCCVVCCPACLALSITPPSCVIQHPLATQIIYLNLIVVFIIPVESSTSLFFENPADCQCGGPNHDHNIHVDTPIITPTHKPLHQHVRNGGPVNNLQWFMCIDEISCDSW